MVTDDDSCDRDRLRRQIERQIIELITSVAPRFAEQMVDLLPRRGTAFITEHYAGWTLSTESAAEIAGKTAKTIVDWCEEAKAMGSPLGTKTVNWTVSLPLLLDFIEKHKGDRHARLVAQDRADAVQAKLQKLRGAEEISLPKC